MWQLYGPKYNFWWIAAVNAGVLTVHITILLFSILVMIISTYKHIYPPDLFFRWIMNRISRNICQFDDFFLFHRHKPQQRLLQLEVINLPQFHENHLFLNLYMNLRFPAHNNFRYQHQFRRQLITRLTSLTIFVQLIEFNQVSDLRRLQPLQCPAVHLNPTLISA